MCTYIFNVASHINLQALRGHNKLCLLVVLQVAWYLTQKNSQELFHEISKGIIRRVKQKNHNLHSLQRSLHIVSNILKKGLLSQEESLRDSYALSPRRHFVGHKLYIF